MITVVGPACCAPRVTASVSCGSNATVRPQANYTQVEPSMLPFRCNADVAVRNIEQRVEPRDLDPLAQRKPRAGGLRVLLGGVDPPPPVLQRVLGYQAAFVIDPPHHPPRLGVGRQR